MPDRTHRGAGLYLLAVSPRVVCHTTYDFPQRLFQRQVKHAIFLRAWRQSHGAWKAVLLGFVTGMFFLPLIVLYVMPAFGLVLHQSNTFIFGALTGSESTFGQLLWPTVWLQVDSKHFMSGFYPSLGAVINGVCYAAFFRFAYRKKYEHAAVCGLVRNIYLRLVALVF